MDPKFHVAKFLRSGRDLPSRTEALGRVFRAALWTVRMKSRFGVERRKLALAGMRYLPLDVKKKILGLANLCRISSPHPRVSWPVRSSQTVDHARSQLITLVLLPPNINLTALLHHDENLFQGLLH